MAPIWRKAPLLLFRFPGLMLPIAAAVAVLALGAASQPLFVSSAAGAALDREFAQLGDDAVGLEVGTYGIPVSEQLAAADAAIREEAQRVPRLQDPTVMVEAEPVTVVGSNDDLRMPLLFRTEALEHLPEVEGETSGDGIWLAAGAAEMIGARPGGEVALRYGGHGRRVRVAGVYRDLHEVLPTAYWKPPDPLPAGDPIVQYWGRLGGMIVQPTPSGPAVQPPLVLAERETLSRLSHELLLPASMHWTFPYDVSNPSLSELRRALPSLRTIEGRANDPLDPFGEALRAIHLYQSLIPAESFLPGIAERVTGTVEALSAPVRALSLAAQGLALLVVAVAAAFGAQRRAVELRLLVVQGVPTLMQGAKAALEAVVPTLLGAAIGWAAAVALVRAIGPSPELTPDVISGALRRSLLLAIVPIVVVGLVTAAVARAQAVQGSSRLRGLAARAPWEVMVLVLAGAAYFQLITQPPASDEVGLSGLVLLFPLLLIAGGAGLVARGLARLLPRLRGGGGRDAFGGGSSAAYLARRRLAAAPGSALLLVAASALAIGVLVYAATAAATTDQSLDLKAAVNVGSDVAVTVGRDPGFDLAFPNTRVGRQEADLLGGSAEAQEVDVLAVDPTTFAGAATWSGSFSDVPLDDLLDRLGAEGERLPVLVAGGAAPAEGTLSTSRYQVPVNVAGRLRAFPGMSPDQPLVIVDAERLIAEVDRSGTSSTDERLFLEGTQWIRGNPRDVVDTLHDVGVSDDAITTITSLRTRPDLLARSWALGYLQAVGLVAGLLAFIGTLLYLSARQASREVAYVLARRMGLSAGSHRLSVGVELAGMLGVATITGTLLALLAARLLLAQLDPLPGLAPAPLLAVPTLLLLGMAGAIVLACAVGAAVVQRSADRAKVSEVLRLAA